MFDLMRNWAQACCMCAWHVVRTARKRGAWPDNDVGMSHGAPLQDSLRDSNLRAGNGFTGKTAV